VYTLLDKLDIPKSFKEYGLDEEEYMSKLDDLANKAFGDQCTTANPRLPLVNELKKIMIDAYYGVNL
jgi:acetaldehyde dehydrogenase/alcohol dehydrogenase